MNKTPQEQLGTINNRSSAVNIFNNNAIIPEEDSPKNLNYVLDNNFVNYLKDFATSQKQGRDNFFEEISFDKFSELINSAKNEKEKQIDLLNQLNLFFNDANKFIHSKVENDYGYFESNVMKAGLKSSQVINSIENELKYQSKFSSLLVNMKSGKTSQTQPKIHVSFLDCKKKGKK